MQQMLMACASACDQPTIHQADIQLQNSKCFSGFSSDAPQSPRPIGQAIIAMNHSIRFIVGMLVNQRGQQGRRNAGNDPEINAYIDQVYSPCRPAGMPWYDGSHLAQLITYQAQMFAANCCAYITVNLSRLLQRYVDAQLHQSLRRWNLPKQIFPAMANYVIRRLVNEADVGMGEILDTLRQGNYAQLTVIVSLEVWRVWQTVKHNLLHGQSLDPELVKRNWWQYLPTMYALRQAVERHNAMSPEQRIQAGLQKKAERLFSILPVPDFQQRNVLIDSIALYDILRGAACIDGNRDQHLADLEVFWNAHTYLRRATTETRRFAFTISTDGVSVSVHVRRPSYPAPHADQWGFHQGENNEKEYVPMHIDQDDCTIGIDPGRRSLACACWGPGQHQTWTVSNGKWHEMAGHHFANYQHRMWRQQDPEAQRLFSNVPTAKAVTHQQHVEHMTYVLEHLQQLLDFYQPPQVSTSALEDLSATGEGV